jgi:hypothetical protein
MHAKLMQYWVDSHPASMTKATILADVGFHQRELLPESGVLHQFNQSLLSATSLNPMDYDFSIILKRARQHPCKLR